jgi:hypothetical protein
MVQCLPCPFCQGTWAQEGLSWRIIWDGKGETWEVACTRGCIQGPRRATLTEAVEIWNQLDRTPDRGTRFLVEVAATGEAVPAPMVWGLSDTERYEQWWWDEV